MSDLQRILYVEDQKDIQLVAQVALVNIGGFDLKICSSGEEALEVAEEFRPQLFLLDVMMPGLDGPTTLKELWSNSLLENIPAIFMTAKVQPTEVEHLMSLGALGVISKPFDPMTLAEQITTLLQNGNS